MHWLFYLIMLAIFRREVFEFYDMLIERGVHAVLGLQVGIAHLLPERKPYVPLFVVR